MNIQALYLEMEKDEFLQTTVSGKLEIKGNCIIWTYELYENIDNENDDNYDDEENIGYGFEKASNEEILLMTYRDDLEEIKGFLEESENNSEWEFSEPEISETTISFKIF